MFQKRSIPSLFLMASLGVGAALGASQPKSALADGKAWSKDECGKKFKNSKVKAACTDKGINTPLKMKKLMKEMRKIAGRKDFKCTECHTNAKGEKLKPDFKYDGNASWDKFVGTLDQAVGKVK